MSQESLNAAKAAKERAKTRAAQQAKMFRYGAGLLAFVVTAAVVWKVTK